MCGRRRTRLASLLGGIALILSVLSILAGEALAASTVNLTWEAPGTPDDQYIAGYRIRWSANADGSNGTIVDAGLTYALEISGLPDAAKTYFQGQSYDVLGQESGWSTPPVVKPAIPATMGGLKVNRVILQR